MAYKISQLHKHFIKVNQAYLWRIDKERNQSLDNTCQDYLSKFWIISILQSSINE